MADELQELLQVATAAAREVGTVLVRDQPLARSSVQIKTSAMDVVTKIDLRAEEIIVGWINREMPNDGILAEEGASRVGTTGRRWVIDPLDGTNNFIRGGTTSAVSIGVEIEGVFSVGAVYNPFQDEMFTGVRAEGAYLNGRKLQLGPDRLEWEHAFVGVEGGFDAWARAERAGTLRLLELYAGGIRCIGSASLNLCHLAIGRHDAALCVQVSPWDIAAGTVIVREAGGLVQGLEPGSQPDPGHTLAARPELLEQLRSVIRAAAGLAGQVERS